MEADLKTCRVSCTSSLPDVGTPYRDHLQSPFSDGYSASVFDASLWHGSETSMTTRVNNDLPLPLLPQCESHHSAPNDDASWSAAIQYQHDLPLGITAVGNRPRATKSSGRKGKRQYPPRNPHVSYERPIAHSPQGSSDSGSTPNLMKAYHCTLCPKSLKDNYAWKRHESAVHGFNSTQ
jgi:hypothetical protein